MCKIKFHWNGLVAKKLRFFRSSTWLAGLAQVFEQTWGTPDKWYVHSRQPLPAHNEFLIVESK